MKKREENDVRCVVFHLPVVRLSIIIIIIIVKAIKSNGKRHLISTNA